MTIQLDLFLDSQSVMLTNEVIAALLARDVRRAEVAVNRLRQHDPESPSLAALERLAEGLARWSTPVDDADAIDSAIKWLVQEHEPLAKSSLGTHASLYIVPFYRELARVALGKTYDPVHPNIHSAWLHLRAGEFEQAERSAMAIPGWRELPDALHWLTIARYRSQGLAAARPTLFALAWREPERLPPLLREVEDELLDRDWDRLEAAIATDEIDEAELLSWFPAWYLLEHPGVEKEFDGLEVPDIAPAKAVGLLIQLLQVERQGNVSKRAALREQLRRLNVAFFNVYMNRRRVQLV